MTRISKLSTAAAAIIGFTLAAPAMAQDDMVVTTAVAPGADAKIACLEGFRPRITGLEEIEKNYAPGTDRVVAEVVSQGANIWEVQLGFVGDGGNVYPATPWGPKVYARATCEPIVASGTTME